ncbi:MAG: hypothetical protein FJ293_03125 [Planctomycetes bacterium]|nr:hypothetical protein [Planctomycetota bacterium]
MDPGQRGAIGRAIESGRAAVTAALHASYPGAPGVSAHSFFDEAPATWELDHRGLVWHVALVGVASDAIEVDELDDAFLVRARCPTASTGWLGAVLPIPPGCDRGAPSARFSEAMLEVRVDFNRASDLTDFEP